MILSKGMTLTRGTFIVKRMRKKKHKQTLTRNWSEDQMNKNVVNWLTQDLKDSAVKARG